VPVLDEDMSLCKGWKDILCMRVCICAGEPTISAPY
jgi:hypothetical protein